MVGQVSPSLLRRVAWDARRGDVRRRRRRRCRDRRRNLTGPLERPVPSVRPRAGGGSGWHGGIAVTGVDQVGHAADAARHGRAATRRTSLAVWNATTAGSGSSRRAPATSSLASLPLSSWTVLLDPTLDDDGRPGASAIKLVSGAPGSPRPRPLDQCYLLAVEARAGHRSALERLLARPAVY